MTDPKKRADFSKFIVHLTKDFDGSDAVDNLISILMDKKIEARNAHCLFTKKFDQKKFSDVLKKRFNTVCCTEVPLHQIKEIVADIPGRQVKLKPYGLVFWRGTLLDRGANPAIYINADGTNLRDYLIDQFDDYFYNTNKLKKLKKDEKDFYNEITQYYSLINIISDRYDFSWEREWRH